MENRGRYRSTEYTIKQIIPAPASTKAIIKWDNGEIEKIPVLCIALATHISQYTGEEMQSILYLDATGELFDIYQGFIGVEIDGKESHW